MLFCEFYIFSSGNSNFHMFSRFFTVEGRISYIFDVFLVFSSLPTRSVQPGFNWRVKSSFTEARTALPLEVDRDGSSQREDEGSQDVDLISLQTVMFQSFSVSQKSS